MNLDIKIKNGEKFYYVKDYEVKSGTVDKIEIFEDYFRYVNEDKDILVNWFTNKDIDNDRTNNSEALSTRIFTTEEKAKNSYEFQHSILHRDVEKIRQLLINVKNMENVKLFYPEEKLNEIQDLLDQVKSKYCVDKVKEEA